MNILDYIAYETERQSGTPAEQEGMEIAWAWVRSLWPLRLLVTDTIEMAYYINGSTGFRKVPAVFNQGNPALPPGQIDNAMIRLFQAEDWMSPDEFTKEFLEIHPFADGNGRVASLIWNYLSGTIEDPEPMPYFFGQDNG
jgi:hypothetical protein